MFWNHLYRDPPEIKHKIDIWPEWTKDTLSEEEWGSQDKESNAVKGKEKVITETKVELFEDPEGNTILPPSLIVCQWLRPQQLNILNPLNSKKPVVAVDNNSYDYFDLVSASKEALKSETLRYIVSQINLLFHLTNPPTSDKSNGNEALNKKGQKGKKNKNKNNSDENDEENSNNNANESRVLELICEEHENDDNLNNNNKKNKVPNKKNDEEMDNVQEPSSSNFDFNNKLYRILPDWKPWYHIFSSTASGGSDKSKKNTREAPKDTSNEVFKTVPSVNSHGKYLVRLHWMGHWRKITVDDRIPVGKNNTILLPMTFNNNNLELWPMLLTKALLKIAALDYPVNYPVEEMEWEFGDMSVIQCLTSWVPELLPLQEINENDLWNFLLLNVDNYKQPQEKPQASLEDTTEIQDNSNKNKKNLKRSMSKQQSTKEEAPPPKPPILPGTPDLIILGLYRGNTKPVLLKKEKKELTRRYFDLVQYGLTPDTSHPLFISQVRNMRLVKRAAKAVLPAWMLVRPPTMACPEDETEDIKALMLVSGFVNNNTELECMNEDIKSMMNKDKPASNIVNTSQKPQEEEVERPASKKSSKKASKMSRQETSQESPPLPPLPKLPVLRNFWMDFKVFLQNFSFMLVLHKWDSYKHNYKFSDHPLDAESSVNDENHANKSNNAKKAELPLDKEKSIKFHEYSPKFLYVDFSEPTEIIVNFTCFCKWNGLPISKYVYDQKTLKHQEIFDINPPNLEEIALKNKKPKNKSHYVKPQSAELLSNYHYYMDPDGEMRRVATQATVMGGDFEREDGFFRGLCCCDIHPSCCPPHSTEQADQDDDDEDEEVLGDKEEEEEENGPADNSECMNDGSGKCKKYKQVKKNRKIKERVVTNVVYSEQVFMFDDVEEDGGVSIDAGCPPLEHLQARADDSITRNGILLISDYSWKYPPTQEMAATIKTTGSQSLLLAISPGRKILKLEVSSPSYSHIHLLSEKDFVLGSEEDVMSHLLEESKLLIEYSKKTSKWLSKLFMAYGRWEKYKQCLSYILYNLLSCSFLLPDENTGNKNNNNMVNSDIGNYLNSELDEEDGDLKKFDEMNNKQSFGGNISNTFEFNESFKGIHYLRENSNYFKIKDKSALPCEEQNTNVSNNKLVELFTFCDSHLSFRKQEEVFRQAIYTAIIELDNKQMQNKTEEVADKKRAHSKKQTSEEEEVKGAPKSLRTAQMNFALRVLLFDPTTPNPLSVDYSLHPEDLKNQSRVSLEKNKIKKGNKSVAGEHPNEDNSNKAFKEFLSESSALRLYCAAVKIQRYWRGHFFRRICKLRCMPQINSGKNKKHYNSVMDMAILLAQTIRSNAEFFGLQFYKRVFRLYPEWLRFFSFHDDEDVRCAMNAFEGCVSLDAEDYSVVLRDIFHATEENMLGLFKFYCYPPVKNTNHFLLRVYNNDTNCLVACTLKEAKPLVYFPNKYGYTVVVFQRKKDDQMSEEADENLNNSAVKTKKKSLEKKPSESSLLCDWSLKLFGSAINGCMVRRQPEKPLNVNFNVTNISEYLVPERSLFIFRYRLWVTQSQLVSLHLSSSDPCAILELNIFEDDAARMSVKGQGSVFVPSFHLVHLQPDEPPPCPSQDAASKLDVSNEDSEEEKEVSEKNVDEFETALESEELPVDQLNYGVDANEIKELKEKLSARNDKQMDVFSSFPTISNVPRRLVERHQYKVEAVIVNDSWSLSQEEEKEIQKLRKSKSYVKSTDNKQSKTLQKDWKESMQTPSTHDVIDTSLPHWTLKVVTDADVPQETLVMHKNTDGADLLEKWKASWDVGRKKRAQVRRQEFICKHLLEDVKLSEGEKEKDECDSMGKIFFEKDKIQKSEKTTNNKNEKAKEKENEEEEEEEEEEGEEEEEIIDAIEKDKDDEKKAKLSLVHNKHNQIPDFVEIYLENIRIDTCPKSDFCKFLNKSENKNININNSKNTFDEMKIINNDNNKIKNTKIDETVVNELRKLHATNCALNIDDILTNYQESKFMSEKDGGRKDCEGDEMYKETWVTPGGADECAGQGGDLATNTNNSAGDFAPAADTACVNTLECLYACPKEEEEEEEEEDEEGEVDYHMDLDCLQAEMDNFESIHLQTELWKSTLKERSKEVLIKTWNEYKGLEANWVERMVEAVNNREELKKQLMLERIEKEKEAQKRMEDEEASTKDLASEARKSKTKGRKSEKSKK